MLNVMARKRRGAAGADPPPEKVPLYNLFTRIDPVIGRAWDAYINSTKPKTTLRGAMEHVLTEFLERHGFYPPPVEATPQQD